MKIRLSVLTKIKCSKTLKICKAFPWFSLFSVFSVSVFISISIFISLSSSQSLVTFSFKYIYLSLTLSFSFFPVLSSNLSLILCKHSSNPFFQINDKNVLLRCNICDGCFKIFRNSKFLRKVYLNTSDTCPSFVLFYNYHNHKRNNRK